MNTQQALHDLGLSIKEAAVYMSLLSLGKAHVTAIAKHSGLKRPTIYILLEELRKKGLVLKIPYAKKSLFIAKEPDEFYRDALIKTQEAYQTLSSLKALHRKDDKVSTMYFEGEVGVKEALWYKHNELKNSEIIGFFAKADKISPELLEMSHQWRQAMSELNITLRGIAPEHPSLQAFRETDAQVRHIFKAIPAAQYSSNVSLDATDLFIRVVLFDQQQAIIIENPEIVKTVRQIFELSWGKL